MPRRVCAIVDGVVALLVGSGGKGGIEIDKKETILLDARLVSVIDNNAFGAELRNGHRFVAFFRRGDAGRITPEIGARVMVEMSPYDMSKGRLVINQEQ